MNLTWLNYFLGVCSAILVGFSKTGLPGVSIPAILLMTEACPNDARASVAAILPVLLVGDIFAVVWFHHHANWPRLWRLFPWVIAGMVPGIFVLHYLDGNRLRPWIGWLVLTMLAIELWRRWREWKTVGQLVPTPIRSTRELNVICSNCELYGLSPCEDCVKLTTARSASTHALSFSRSGYDSSYARSAVATQLLDAPASKETLIDIESTQTISSNALSNESDPPTHVDIFPHSPWFIALTGFLAGFSTFIANAAMPVMSVYLISQGFNKREFLGTAAWFFFLLNLSKTPFYLGMGMFETWMLPFDLWLVAPVLLGSIVGLAILRYIPQRFFNALALLLAGVAAIKLMVV